jgi:hypothetical protein
MNTPWIIGTVIAIAFFAYFEKRAFDFPNSQNTLSRWIYDIGKNWPLSIWLMGMGSGGSLFISFGIGARRDRSRREC